MLTPDQSIRKLATEKQAIKAVSLIRNHLRGEEELNEIEIETYRHIIKEYSKDMFFFCKYVLGFDKINEPHRRWLDKLTKDIFIIINMIRLKPRGVFKTTLYGIGLMLWFWAIISRQARFLYASANEALLDEVSSEIHKFLEPTSIYSFIFGITIDESEKNTSYVINIIGREGKGFSLTLKTSGSSTAGLHPHCIIVDDPSDQKDRDSRVVRESKYRWADSLVSLIVPLQIGNLILKHTIFVATRWHMEDVIWYLIEKNKKLLDKDKFDIEVEEIETNGIPNFPDIHNEEGIAYLKSILPDIVYSCQYKNNPLPDGKRVFDIKRLHFRELAEIDINLGINYCFIDPSKGKKESDYPATIFVNQQNGRLFVFDAIDTKILLADLLPIIVRRCGQYKVHTIFYEDNGSNLIDTELLRLLKQQGLICIVKPIFERRNKPERIKGSQPYIYSGQIYFRSDYSNAYPECMAQIVNYPAWGNDDFPDVVEKSINELTQKATETRIRFI